MLEQFSITSTKIEKYETFKFVKNTQFIKFQFY